jgi:two-component system chemotaxis sensor kinase CheA
MVQKDYLFENTSVFGSSIIQVINDMVGLQFSVSDNIKVERRFTCSRSMLVSIHFAGIIQGEYVIGVDELTAAKMIGMYNDGDTLDSIKTNREEYSGFLKEALNQTVGMAILPLEEEFDGLTFSPAIAIYGELEYPQVPVGRMTLSADIGDIDCYFILNMTNLGIGEKLQQALADIKDKNLALQAVQANVKSMLEVFPAGLVAIDQGGKILPGHSKKTNETVGIDENIPVDNMLLTEILGLDPEKDQNRVKDFMNWIDLAFLKFEELDFKIIESVQPFAEFTNRYGKVLHIKCIPMIAQDSKKLDRILVVIEDVSYQRKMEAEMKHISRQHEMNLELLSQVINLEPDEVAEFVYDSSELVERAETILKSANRDREFINTLYRTIHTLKGTSGQYQFKQLQEMAHTIESELSPYRETGEINAHAVEQIEKEITELDTYISKLQEIQKKLGGVNETMKGKAERNVPSMLVPLNELNKVIYMATELYLAVKALKKEDIIISGVERLALETMRLRQIDLSFFQPALNAFIQRIAQKLGKKVLLQIKDGQCIDIITSRKLHESFIHLINNAIDHGIELPEERRQSGKAEMGVITICANCNETSCNVVFSDDGRGINVDAIKEKLIDKFGKSAADVDAMTEQELYMAMLLPGFSTKNKVTEISGRGVGLDAVGAMVKDLGGYLKISSTLNKGTQFTLSIPLEKSYPDLQTFYWRS